MQVKSAGSAQFGAKTHVAASVASLQVHQGLSASVHDSWIVHALKLLRSHWHVKSSGSAQLDGNEQVEASFKSEQVQYGLDWSRHASCNVQEDGSLILKQEHVRSVGSKQFAAYTALPCESVEQGRRDWSVQTGE